MSRVIRCLVVPGLPVPHVRMTRGQIGAWRAGNRDVNRQAQRYLAYKDEVGWHWREAHQGVAPFDGPVAIDVQVTLRQPDKRRWDASNVLKAAEDALNGLAYHDDKQIDSARIIIGAGNDDRVTICVEGTTN